MYMGPKRKEPPPPSSPTNSETSTNIASPYSGTVASPYTPLESTSSPPGSEVPTVVREPTSNELQEYNKYIRITRYPELNSDSDPEPYPVVKLPFFDRNETKTIRQTPPQSKRKRDVGDSRKLRKTKGGKTKRKRRRYKAKS